MKFWMGRYLRALREGKDVWPSEIVQWVQNNKGGPIDVGTLYNFEAGRRWPHQVDAIIAAYAVTCGIQDGRDIWDAVLETYRKRGGAPLPNRQPSSAERAVLLALEAAQRKRPCDDESRDKPISIQKHQGGGR